MKLNKSILISTLAAASLFLTACDDKKPAQPAQEQASKAVVTQAQEVKIDDVAAVLNTTREVQTTNGEPSIMIRSQLKNLSNKEIVSARWKTSIVFNDVVILFLEPSFPFNPGIPAQGLYNVSNTVLENSMIHNNRQFLLNPNANLTYKVELYEVKFADGSVVTAK